jgi:hypothetical protein
MGSGQVTVCTHNVARGTIFLLLAGVHSDEVGTLWTGHRIVRSSDRFPMKVVPFISTVQPLAVKGPSPHLKSASGYQGGVHPLI